MAAQHTLGPWSLRAGGDVTVLGQKRHKHADGTEVSYEGEIARVQPQREPGQRRANARLIAAAPELLEAVFNLLHHYGSDEDRALLPAGFQPTCVVGAKQSARAAIAKARPQPEPSND